MSTLIEINKAEGEVTNVEVEKLRERLDGELVTISLNGYVEGVGTMGSTIAIEEWDGSIVRVRVATGHLATAEKVHREGEE